MQGLAYALRGPSVTIPYIEHFTFFCIFHTYTFNRIKKAYIEGGVPFEPQAPIWIPFSNNVKYKNKMVHADIRSLK